MSLNAEKLAEEFGRSEVQICAEETDRLKYAAVEALGKYSDRLKWIGDTKQMYRVNQAIYMLWEVPPVSTCNGPG